jgi:hypothetical protein
MDERAETRTVRLDVLGSGAAGVEPVRDPFAEVEV